VIEHGGGTADREITLLTGGYGISRVASSDIMLADQRQDPSRNARAASLSSEAVPTDLLTIRAPAPDWFRWAISHPRQSQFVMVAGCRIHYLYWAREPARPGGRGLLFIHGGGAHSYWWSYIAPYFTRDFRVAAIDLSGMGDSGWRAHYTSELRAEEIRAVMAAAQLGERPFVIGHSFGGFMTMKVASQYGDRLGGAVIVDSPIRPPEEEARHPLTRPPMGNRRVYETFDAALARFRLMPEQPCDNPFIVEFIGRHSLRRAEDGWVWKFDSEAMGSRRFGEPVREYLQAVGCRAALIFGEKSALVSRETASYMSSLMGPRAPVVEVPEARHHVMLDQPLGFVAALRMLLDSWMRNESAEGSGPLRATRDN
jgi:pimeloyl-ACP methyl ester carboxylesterase